MKNLVKGARSSSYGSLLVLGFAVLLVTVAMIAGPVSSAQNQKSNSRKSDKAAPTEEAREQTSQPFDIRKEVLAGDEFSLRSKSVPQSKGGNRIIIPTGAAPSNDLCAGAEVIPGGGPFPVLSAVTPDITDAAVTGDPPLPTCQTSVSRSIWYTFTPATSGVYRVSTCAATPTGTTVDDTVLGIYTSTGGCAGPFTELPPSVFSDGCDDDSCATETLQSVLSTTLNAGTTYYFVVWQFDIPPPTAGNTAVQVAVELIPPPPNETCASTTPLTLNIPVAASTTASITNDYQLSLPSTCFAGTGNTATVASGRDVVYSFTAPAAGSYSFRAWQYVSASSSNAVVYLSDTCPAATPGTPVDVSCTAASNFQPSTGGEELNCVSLTAGQQVFFFVDELVLGAGGTFYALVEPCGPSETEPNDTPATAIPLSCGIQGAVNPATEADFYSLGTPAAGSRLFAMVDASTAGASTTSQDVDLRVNTATDTVEYDDLDADVQFGIASFAPSIAGTTATGAALFYQVDRFGNAVTTAFPYRLYSVIQPPSTNATAESEPNDLTSNASAAGNNYFSGALAGPAPSTDVDHYAFDAVAGDLIMLNVDGNPSRTGTAVDTRLQLLDSAGAVLVNVNGSSSTVNVDNANPPGLFEILPQFPSEALIFHAQTTGRYYARVSAAVTGATGVGNYLLSISKNCTIGGGPVPGAGTLLISEFRLRGPNGVNDEFIEAYNASGANHTVAGSGTGYAIAASDGVARCVIPNGTVIPARGHFLCVNSVGYSLASYPAGSGTTATGDATYVTDIPDNAGIAIFNTSLPGDFTLANRLDAVGSNTEANTLYKEGTGYPALTVSSADYSFYRNLRSGLPQDTNDNFASGTAEPAGAIPQNDFVIADTIALSTPAGQRLGAPGPENLSSPLQRNSTVKASLIAPCVSSASPPNRVRTGSGNSGTLEIRRKFTNNTGAAVARLRFRIVDVTTNPPPVGQADLRAVTSVASTPAQPCGGGTVAVEGLTLETPPTQAAGGGFNSSLSAGTITLAAPLAAGATINVNFLLNVAQGGNFRFFVNVEGLP